MKWWYQSLSSQQQLVCKFESVSLHNLKFEGEISSTDYESVESFLSVLKKLTEENGYLVELVFVADETGVIWKWIPVHMFIHKTEKVDSGFKLAKDHITLLFCCSAAGDMLKPLLFL
jgi:hypothetical protein